MSLSPNLTGYSLTYDDEFSSASAFQWSPDGSTGYQTTPYSGNRTLAANGEVSMYSDASVGFDPFEVSGGALHITAAPAGPDGNAYGLPYDTGMIATNNLFNQQWGYYEIRAEVAEGKGMWSAFYTLPTDKAWPPEVDTMEAFGANNPQFGGGPSEYYHGTIAPNRDTESGGGWAQVPGNDIYTGYHTYGIDVQPDHITWYFDGQVLNNVGTLPTGAGYDRPMYMVIALAVGGWAGQPEGETGVYNIDYIRAYSKDPNATPVEFQAMSSPDGANTIPGEATTASDVSLVPTAITIQASQDHYGWSDAAFIVTVDGVQVGGLQTVTASHGDGAWQTISLDANLRDVPHEIGITFVNDDYASADADRNLYIDSVAVDGVAIAGSSVALRDNGTARFDEPGAAGSDSPPPPPPGDANLVVRVSEDAWNGDAQFTVKVDGVQVGGTQTTTASHNAGEWQDIALAGTWGAGPHTVDVTFLNDGWGGSAATDRNLYVQSVTINGDTVPFTAAHNDASNGQTATDATVLAINGTASFIDDGSSPPPDGGGTGGTGGLVVRVAEDAWNGDAQFTVTVDGAQFGGVQTVIGSHAADGWQDIAIAGTLASGPHTVGINFINDAWGGTAATDRNMYVQSITVNGETLSGTSAENTAANGESALDPDAAVMAINGTATFHSTGTATGTGTGTGGGGTVQPSTVVLHMSEDAWNGDAQFQVMVDGAQVGAVQTATASHTAGQVQDITLSGDFGAQGPGAVDVVFLNDAWGGSAATDRNLYVQSIDVNGVHFAGNTAANDAANHEEALDPSAAVMAINGTASFAINHTAPPEIVG
jgi:beta-glucanase (GH16 family)